MLPIGMVGVLVGVSEMVGAATFSVLVFVAWPVPRVTGAGPDFTGVAFAVWVFVGAGCGGGGGVVVFGGADGVEAVVVGVVVAAGGFVAGDVVAPVAVVVGAGVVGAGLLTAVLVAGPGADLEPLNTKNPTTRSTSTPAPMLTGMTGNGLLLFSPTRSSVPNETSGSFVRSAGLMGGIM